MQQGFYLVRQSDKARFFISPTVSEPALHRVCDKVLSDRHGWDYWIDKCLGLDINGNIAWINLDCTDSFI